MKAIANVTDSDYAYYTPYIARVLGSWFRDTYFVIPETADTAIKDYINEADRNEVEMSMIENSYGTDGEYVVVDEEYLAETGEYWTSYEMVQDENGNDTDEYQLYYLNPNGITSGYTLEEFLEDPYTCLEDYKEGYASKVGVASEDTYSSQEEAEEAGHAFVKKTKVNTYLGLSSSSLEKVVWSAYGFGEGGESGWTKVTNYESNDYMVAVYEQIESGGGQVNNTEDGGFYYNVSSTASVTQTEDAQRSQTNPTVKWLFKYRKYYIYDGSTDTALAIAEDKEAVLEAVQSYLQQKYVAAKYVAVMLGTYGRSANRQAYLSFTESNVTTLANIALSVATGGVSGVVLELAEGVSYNWDDVTEQWLEWQLDMYYSGDTGDYEGVLIDEIKWSDYGLDEERDYGDPRNPDLIATVNITKNSLNAFSILENTQTYAAEYAYRDFKELIVELDYFDKEDLSDAISSVFTWVLPDITAIGWPNRPWDKQSNDYGALIESATTYDYLEEVDYDPSTMSAIESTAEDDEEEGTTDTDTSTETETDDTTTDSNGSQTILDKAQEILDVMDSENWSYQSGCWSGRTTWEDAQDGSKVSSCATYVSWVLQEAGYLESGKALSHGDEGSSTESVYESYADNLTDATWYYPECTTKDYDLVPGDIVIVERSGSWRTIAIYAGKDSSGNNTFYGAINDNMLKAEYDANGPVVWDNELNNETLKIVVRFPGDSTSTSTTFEGYSGGEAVVSPVTGKVLSYGTHERTNVYTGDTEIVGFITIEAMSTTNQLSSSDVSVNSAEGEGKEITNDEIATAYGYFADEYEDTCQGYVITIDGINVDLNMTVDDAYGAYEKNEVAKLYNKDTQADREAEEDLKYDAPFFINVGGTETIETLPDVTDYSQENVVYTCSDDCTYYIKEGKYIGTTMTDEEAELRVIEEGSTIAQTVTYGEEAGDVTTSDFTYDGPANYMRIIMKDTNYSIVDDVEDYFDIPDPEDDTSSGTLFTDLSEEILYWILVDCEGTCDWDDSAGTSGTTDLGDGTISTSLGVTNHCESIAESLGYGSYWPMSLGDRIPNDVVSDVAIAFLGSTLDTLQSKYPDRTFTETQMAALMSIYYNFGHVPSAIDSLLSSSASDQEIYEVWSTIRDTATSAGYATYPGWAKRDTAEANMWLTGEWYECYSGVKIRFISETPYSDFLSNSSAQVYESAE